MEALTPVQRVIVIIIGLVLTAAIALLVLPWISEQIEDRFMSDEDSVSCTYPPSPGRSDAPAAKVKLAWTAAPLTVLPQTVD